MANCEFSWALNNMNKICRLLKVKRKLKTQLLLTIMKDGYYKVLPEVVILGQTMIFS